MSRKHRKKGGWKYTAGRRPYRVTVRERPDCGGTIFGAIWDSKKGRYVRRSLRHKDRDRAMAWADEQAAALRKGMSELQQGRVSLGQVVAAYLDTRTPHKSATTQKADHQLADFWLTVLGADRDPHTVSIRDWDEVIAERRSGAIDSHGRPAAPADRRPVGDRSVEVTCKWLRQVFRWAVQYRAPEGFYLMRENPVRGFAVPKGATPRRPVATHDRYEAVRAVSDQVPMEMRFRKRREPQRSYLSELLDIVNGTGRRITAACSLTYADLRLHDGTRYGSIRWPADTDKMGRESTVPMSQEVRAAVDRILSERPGIGAAPIFPKPSDPARPITRHLAAKWLQRAERLAGLEPQEGSLWHAYRRKWATERKHLPVQDVAKTGGWKSHSVVQDIYQQPDSGTMFDVVTSPRRLREAR